MKNRGGSSLENGHSKLVWFGSQICSIEKKLQISDLNFRLRKRERERGRERESEYERKRERERTRERERCIKTNSQTF